MSHKHKQETETRAFVAVGRDRTPGVKDWQEGNEARFFRSFDHQLLEKMFKGLQESAVLEEVLADPNMGKRMLAPEVITIRPEPLHEDLINPMMNERFGREVFKREVVAVHAYHGAIKQIVGTVGIEKCIVPKAEGEIVPLAYRLDVKDETPLEVVPGSNQGTKNEALEKEFAERMTAIFKANKLDPQIFRPVLESLDLNEDLEWAGKGEPETVWILDESVTDEEKDTILSLKEELNPKPYDIPRPGEREDWVWGRIWESDGVTSWHYVPGPNSEELYLEEGDEAAQFVESLGWVEEGTERPDDVFKRFADAFDPNMNDTTVVNALLDQGLDPLEFGFKQKHIDNALKQKSRIGKW